jgi:L-rhamnose mutarotase
MKNNINRHCYSCDLKDNPDLIAAYKEHHQPSNVWPEITESIKSSGIVNMQIYLTGNRLFMIIDVNDDFDPIKKAEKDAADPKVQEWEELMWAFQKALPWAKAGEKWVKMEAIFNL